MPKADTTSTRLPRGSRPVSEAFLNALEAIPEASRAAVAKAAQGLIRDQMKLQREKTKTNAAKGKAAAIASKARKSATEQPAAAIKVMPRRKRLLV